MRKLAIIALGAVALTARADMPDHFEMPVHRLHRVGYEILPEDGLKGSTPSDSDVSLVDWCGMVIAIALGVVLLIDVKLNLHRGVWYVMKQNVLAAACIVGLGCAPWWLKWLGSIVGDGSAIDRPKSWYLRSNLGDRYRYVHVNEPGWKYEDEVGWSEEDRLKAQVKAVKNDLQAKVNGRVDLIWRDRPRWKEQAVEKILSENDDLRKRCRGIPIEYIAEDLDFMGFLKNDKEEWRKLIPRRSYLK